MANDFDALTGRLVGKGEGERGTDRRTPEHWTTVRNGTTGRYTGKREWVHRHTYEQQERR